MSKRKLTESHEDAKKLIDSVIKHEMNLTSDEYIAEENDEVYAWTIPDSYNGLLFINLEKGEEAYNSNIAIIRPISKLPEKNILAFYRMCLDVNFNTTNVWLAMNGEDLILINRRPILGLDKEEVMNCIGFILNALENLMNRFYEEFGAEIWVMQ